MLARVTQEEINGRTTPLINEYASTEEETEDEHDDTVEPMDIGTDNEYTQRPMPEDEADIEYEQRDLVSAGEETETDDDIFKEADATPSTQDEDEDEDHGPFVSASIKFEDEFDEHQAHEEAASQYSRLYSPFGEEELEHDFVGINPRGRGASYRTRSRSQSIDSCCINERIDTRSYDQRVRNTTAPRPRAVDPRIHATAPRIQSAAPRTRAVDPRTHPIDLRLNARKLARSIGDRSRSFSRATSFNGNGIEFNGSAFDYLSPPVTSSTKRRFMEEEEEPDVMVEQMTARASAILNNAGSDELFDETFGEASEAIGHPHPIPRGALQVAHRSAKQTSSLLEEAGKKLARGVSAHDLADDVMRAVEEARRLVRLSESAWQFILFEIEWQQKMKN